MEFTVSLEQFEGPLDLMLHLIQKNKLDLFDLDLDLLADQYTSFIRQVHRAHLEIASEYIVEFVSLLEYKSRKLLPKKQVVEEDGYEEDQRDRLMARLLEYQRYKEASQVLDRLLEKRSERLERPPASMIEEWSVPRESEAMIHIPVYDLVRAMKRVLHRQAILYPQESSMEVRELSIEERMEQIQRRLPYLKDPSDFETFCRDVSTLHEIIVTFLAILELIHSQILTFQIDDKETIWLYQIKQKTEQQQS